MSVFGPHPSEAQAASLRRLHRLVRSINGDLDLERTLHAVCRGVVEGLGFQIAVVNLVMPDGALEVVSCEGSDEACARLLGQRGSRAEWDRWMAACDPVGELLVDYRHVAAGGVPTWVPDVPHLAQEGAWEPGDELLAPLRTPGSGLLGVISVDLPDDGMRPGPAQLELLEMYAAQASIAVENAQLHSALKAEDAARARVLSRLSAVVDSAPVAIVELDLQGRVQLWNDAAEQIFGWSEQEVLGRRNPVPSEEQFEAYALELARGTSTRRVEVSRSRRDGTSVDVEVTASTLTDQAGQPYGYLGVYVDVTDRLQLERELRTAAYTDALTGLANRAHFSARLRAAAYGASVVLLDLDGFKGVNDTLGHLVGDRVLTEVARRLRATCREQDLIARLGGDEFVVLLLPTGPGPDAGTAARGAAEALAGRLVQVMAEPFDLGDRRVALGASIGLAHADLRAGPPDPVDSEEGQALLRDADVAMYAAKAAGKGRAQVFEPALREAVVQRADLVQDLQAGLGRNELFLRWHPVADVRSGRVVGLEGLARWQHPERGELLPRDFIHVAEDTGLIVPLGTEMLVEACAGLRRWQDSCPTGRSLIVSVNLSPVQLRSDGLVGTVRDALRDSGVAPGNLVLELTENVLLHDVDEAIVGLEELRALGVRLALDDFGAGYSSLAYLKRLPIDIVKLDRSLLADTDTSPAALALVDAVLAMTRRLRLVTLAEGVETLGQWRLLRRLGCAFAQGYLLAEPLLARDVPAVLHAGYPCVPADRRSGTGQR